MRKLSNKIRTSLNTRLAKLKKKKENPTLEDGIKIFLNTIRRYEREMDAAWQEGKIYSVTEGKIKCGFEENLICDRREKK